jgi:hypothetical protein
LAALAFQKIKTKNQTFLFFGFLQKTEKTMVFKKKLFVSSGRE